MVAQISVENAAPVLSLSRLQSSNLHTVAFKREKQKSGRCWICLCPCCIVQHRKQTWWLVAITEIDFFCYHAPFCICREKRSLISLDLLNEYRQKWTLESTWFMASVMITSSILTCEGIALLKRAPYLMLQILFTFTFQWDFFFLNW